MWIIPYMTTFTFQDQLIKSNMGHHINIYYQPKQRITKVKSLEIYQISTSSSIPPEWVPFI